MNYEQSKVEILRLKEKIGDGTITEADIAKFALAFRSSRKKELEPNIFSNTSLSVYEGIAFANFINEGK